MVQLVTAIVEVRNASSFDAVVTNHETTGDTDGGKGNVPAGNIKPIYFWIPQCSSASVDFSRKRVTVELFDSGTLVRTFTIWQSDSAGRVADRVRVSTDGAWHDPGDVIGGLAAAGPVEALTWLGDRSLVIQDYSVWLLPKVLVDAVNTVHAALAAEGVRICDERHQNLEVAPSVPRSKVVAFSMAGIPSDAFDRQDGNARFLYRDSGKRYEFVLSNGRITVGPSKVLVKSFEDPQKMVPALSEAVSYNSIRRGEKIPLPQFDMVAANGGRVFAKEKGTDRFFSPSSTRCSFIKG